MTTHPDPTPDAASLERAEMSEERIAEIRAEADRVFRNQDVYQLMDEIDRLEAVIAEREAEIARYREAVNARLAALAAVDALQPARFDRRSDASAQGRGGAR